MNKFYQAHVRDHRHPAEPKIPAPAEIEFLKQIKVGEEVFRHYDYIWLVPKYVFNLIIGIIKVQRKIKKALQLWKVQTGQLNAMHLCLTSAIIRCVFSVRLHKLNFLQ